MFALQQKRRAAHEWVGATTAAASRGKAAKLVAMARTLDQLINEALLLPDSERAHIATRLLESLDGAKDEAVDAAWAAEIERRCADRDSGRTFGADWEDVRRRIETEIFSR